MTIEQILEILENYKLRIPPTVFYDLKADIVNFEEPATKNDLGVEKIIDEIEKEFEKVDIPIMDKLTLFAKVQNALYKCAESNSEIPNNSTTKNYLGVDCISRAQTQTEIEMNASRYTIAKERGGMGQVEWSDQLIKVSDAVDIIRNLPSVTPQEPQSFEWCETCKEYDQEKHCCHRWSKVIRNTVEELKQEYIEREVLDKIDEIITDALDKSTDQKECQTLRWVLDKMSEVT